MRKLVLLSAFLCTFFVLTISMGATAFAYTWHHTATHAWDTVYNDHHYFMQGNVTLTEHYDGCHGLGVYNYTSKLTVKADPALYGQNGFIGDTMTATTIVTKTNGTVVSQTDTQVISSNNRAVEEAFVTSKAKKVIHETKLEDRNSSGTLIDTYWVTITVQ